MRPFTGVTLGKENKQKANAPEGSKPQSNIMITEKSGSSKTTGSGWEIWKEGDIFYHLGGSRKSAGRQPRIYFLKDEGNWSYVKERQGEAWERYGKYKLIS